MMKMPIKSGLFLVGLGAGLLVMACSGFGSTCSTTADCPNGSSCDPTLKVCFSNPPVPPVTTVTAIAPANGTANVPTASAVVTATFSAAVVDAGVTDTTFVLDGQGFNTPGNYVASANAKQETYVPLAGLLALGTQYTVSLTNGIIDVNGFPITPFTSTFSTQDGSWQSSQALPSPTGTSTGDNSINVNFYGEVVAGYDNRFAAGDGYELLAGVSVSGGPVQINQRIYSVHGDEVYGPSFAISNSGRAFAAFNVIRTGGIAVLASFNDPSVGTWSTPVDLPITPTLLGASAQIVALPQGTALGAWTQAPASGANYQVFGRAYSPSSGWAPQQVTIQGDTTITCDEIRLAGDLNQNVLATWVQSSGTTTTQIFAAYRPPSGTFGTPVLLSNAANNAQSAGAVALGYAGAGAVAWLEYNGTVYHAFARPFSPSTASFGSAQQLDTAGSGAFTPAVGASSAGDVLVVWEEPGTTGGKISARSYTASSATWSAPVVLVTDTTNAPSVPTVGVDPGGNAIVVWNQSSSTSTQLYGRRYTVSGGWVPPLAQPPSQLTFLTSGAYLGYTVVDGTGRGTTYATDGAGLGMDAVAFQ
jgi:hypothetical protein